MRACCRPCASFMPCTGQVLSVTAASLARASLWVVRCQAGSSAHARAAAARPWLSELAAARSARHGCQCWKRTQGALAACADVQDRADRRRPVRGGVVSKLGHPCSTPPATEQLGFQQLSATHRCLAAQQQVQPEAGPSEAASCTTLPAAEASAWPGCSCASLPACRGWRPACCWLCRRLLARGPASLLSAPAAPPQLTKQHWAPGCA
jgi:hypothetical protein